MATSLIKKEETKNVELTNNFINKEEKRYVEMKICFITIRRNLIGGARNK